MDNSSTYSVKWRDAQGQISYKKTKDFEEANAIMSEYLSKGFYAWIEDAQGRLVGFQRTAYIDTP
jgi:hypothetical protein